MKDRHFLCIAILLGCIQTVFSQRSLSGSWRFMGYRNISTNYLKIQNYSSYRYGSIMLIFHDSLGTGVFDGHTISNTLTGEYQIIDDKTILFSNVTRGLFPEENEIMDIRTGLKGRTSYEVNDNSLKISYNNGQEELNFVRVSYTLEGTWKLKQVTERLSSNPNMAYDENVRFRFEENKVEIYHVSDIKKSITKGIIQTNLFHKFQVEEIKKSEIAQKDIDMSVVELLAEAFKYEIYSNQMFWYSEKYKVVLVPSDK